MQKLLLMSVLIATFAVPVAVRRRGTTTDAFASIARPFLLFVAFYVFGLLYIYPRLS